MDGWMENHYKMNTSFIRDIEVFSTTIITAAIINCIQFSKRHGEIQCDETVNCGTCSNHLIDSYSIVHLLTDAASQ